MTEGRCLCGAVRVTVGSLSGTISACHCDMCRRWSGGVMMGVDAEAAGLTVTGPVKVFASSPFAERAWCDTCGSALWFRDTDPDKGVYELMPGLFDDAGGATLTREVYADRCPSGYAFAGDLTRVTEADYEARELHVKGNEP